MGAFGDIIGAFEGDPTFKVLDETKNRQLQAQLEAMLTDFSSAKSKGQSAIDDFIAQFKAKSPEITGETNQEIGNIDRYYNGDVENQLSGLRSRRAAAVKNAGDLALARAYKNRNLSQLVSGGGANSYLARLGLKNSTDVGVGEALDQSNQERNDYGWLESQKSNLTGKRANLQDSLLNRILTPSRTQNAFNSSNLGFLQGWQQVNNANKFYGLQQNRTVADRVGQGLDGALQLVMDYYTGGMAKNPANSYTANWGAGGSGGGMAPNQYNNPGGAGYVTPLNGGSLDQGGAMPAGAGDAGGSAADGFGFGGFA